MNAFEGHLVLQEGLLVKAGMRRSISSPRLFPHADLAEYLAAALTITFASFMGFADDVLDLRCSALANNPFRLKLAKSFRTK